MLDSTALARLPSSIRFYRNGRPVDAVREDVGSVRVDDGRLWIADAGLVERVPPLPVGVPRGTHRVCAYRWHHASGPVNVCLVVAFTRAFLPRSRRLTITTDVRPDLADGIIVDTAEVAVVGADALTERSGLGDGYYPVFANYNLGLKLQSLVVDFKLWEVRRVVLMRGSTLDDYGMVTSAPLTPEEEAEAEAETERRQREFVESPEIREIRAIIEKLHRFFDLCKRVGFDRKALPPGSGDRTPDPVAATQALDRYRGDPTDANADLARSAVIDYIRSLPVDPRTVEAWEAGFRRRRMSDFTA